MKSGSFLPLLYIRVHFGKPFGDTKYRKEKTMGTPIIPGLAGTQTEKNLNEAQKLLDKAHNYYEETHAEFERQKEDWGVVTTEEE